MRDETFYALQALSITYKLHMHNQNYHTAGKRRSCSPTNIAEIFTRSNYRSGRRPIPKDTRSFQNHRTIHSLYKALKTVHNDDPMHHNPEQFLQNRNLALQQEARHKMKPNDFLFAHIQELDGNLSDLGISSTDTDRAYEYLEYLSNSLSEVDRLKDDYEIAKKLVKNAPGIVEFLLERDWELGMACQEG